MKKTVYTVDDFKRWGSQGGRVKTPKKTAAAKKNVIKAAAALKRKRQQLKLKLK